MRNKYYFIFIFIFVFIGLGLSSCKKESDKIIIESFDYEINRNKSTIANELSYSLSFDIDFTLNQEFDVNDLVVRISTVEKTIENKKNFHFNLDYSNTENVTFSPSTEQCPYILLNYTMVDVTTLNVNAQLKITSKDLIDDINNFIKINCYCKTKEIVDEHSILNNGYFKMNYFDKETIHYEFDEFSESYKVVSVIARSDTFEIPATYNGYPVKAIGEGAFYGCTSIKNITIPDSITSIGKEAFEGCDNIEQATIPAIAIPLISKNNLKEVIITSGSSIGEGAFSNCSNLVSITISDSVASIGESAFEGCDNIEQATIPTLAIPFIPKKNLKEVIITSGTSIENDAFKGCNSLTSITIPTSVTSIDGSAFLDCFRLVEVYNLSSLNITMGSSNNGDIGYYARVIHTSLEEPSSFITKDDYAFVKDKENKYYLVGYNGIATDLVLPNDIEENTYEINSGAFSYCSNLTSITIPDKVTSIGEHAFYNCSSLTSIVIPNSVTSIGNGAYAYCRSLTSIVIPNSVTNIGYSAFSYCTSLESITIPFVGASLNGTENTHFGYIFGASSYSNNSTYVPNSLKEVVILGGQFIGEYAFCWCSSLTSITIPNSVTSIGNYAFFDCSSLKSITIPTSVTNIGSSAFQDCSRLTSIVIPNSVTSMGAHIFYGCSGLTSIVIPKSITSLAEGFFYNCKNLVSVTIPTSVTSIGKCACYKCDSLKELYYKGTTTDWSNINIGIINSELTSATVYYYSETKPTEKGNYWHYVDGKPTKW